MSTACFRWHPGLLHFTNGDIELALLSGSFRGSSSGVSTPIFASKAGFFNFFRALHHFTDVIAEIYHSKNCRTIFFANDIRTFKQILSTFHELSYQKYANSIFTLIFLNQILKRMLMILMPR